MELREVLAALRAAWWLPLVGLLVGAVLALGIEPAADARCTRRRPSFRVDHPDSGSTSEAFQGSQFSQQRVTSYAGCIDRRGTRRPRHRPARSRRHARRAERADHGHSGAPTPSSSTSRSPIPRRSRPSGSQSDRRASSPSSSTELETREGGALASPGQGHRDRPTVATRRVRRRPLRNVALGWSARAADRRGACDPPAGSTGRSRDPEEAATLAGAPVIGTCSGTKSSRSGT